jgi:positive regulator of sigma E activity
MLESYRKTKKNCIFNFNFFFFIKITGTLKKLKVTKTLKVIIYQKSSSSLIIYLTPLTFLTLIIFALTTFLAFKAETFINNHLNIILQIT